MNWRRRGTRDSGTFSGQKGKRLGRNILKDQVANEVKVKMGRQCGNVLIESVVVLRGVHHYLVSDSHFSRYT